jgi:hypothetical protein
MMLRFGNYACGTLACFIVAITVGCGRQGLAPVEGKVTLNGQPLPNATIVLSPVRATDPGPFTGKTDAEGRFALGPADNERGGAVPGEYMLMIATVLSQPNADEMTPPPTQKEMVPAKWRNGTERFTVPDGGTKEADFAMTSR